LATSDRRESDRAEATDAVFAEALSRMTTRADLLKRISIDPQVCFGKPCIRGTRIWMSLLVENLAEGIPEPELLAAYPQLRPDDGHAAEMTRERIIPIAIGSPEE
jgi:uncharacterized protein (DUF433 family)